MLIRDLKPARVSRLKRDTVAGLQNTLVVCCVFIAHSGLCWTLNVSLLDLYDSPEGGEKRDSEYKYSNDAEQKKKLIQISDASH